MGKALVGLVKRAGGLQLMQHLLRNPLLLLHHMQSVQLGLRSLQLGLPLQCLLLQPQPPGQRPPLLPSPSCIFCFKLAQDQAQTAGSNQLVQSDSLE